MSEIRTESILDMAGGAIRKLADRELARCVENILDRRTDQTKKRKITITIELTPSKNLETVDMTASAASKLAPELAVGTTLFFAEDEEGELVVAEWTPENAGQTSLFRDDRRLEAL